jgi:hypothetical protein
MPFAQAGGQLLFHLVSRLYESTSVIVTTNMSPPVEFFPEVGVRNLHFVAIT